MIKKNVEIKINSKNRFVYFEDGFIGLEGENLQGNIIFSFQDEFVNGTPTIKVKQNGEAYNINEVEKVGETYVLPIKSSLIQKPGIDMQLVITEGTDENSIPIFKTNIFFLPAGESILAEEEIPEQYESWMDVANTKLNEIDNLDIDLEDNVVTITRKDGTTKSEYVKGDKGDTGEQGIQGEQGLQGEKGDKGEKGDAYEITEEDYQEIETNVKSDIQPILENIENVANQAEVIARGRATGYVFNTLEDLDTWLLVQENVDKLVLGDNFYIVATDVPDYWWDGNQKRVLETEKPDLTEYAKKEQFVTLTQAEYDDLIEKSANTYYFIIEEE